MTDIGQRLRKDNAPKDMLEAVAEYEARFGIEFETLTYFSKRALALLFGDEAAAGERPPTATVASDTDRSIVGRIAVLGEIANTPSPSVEQRRTYRSTLEDVYRALPVQPTDVDTSGSTLCVAPEREGRILAEAMGWCAGRETSFPQAKRIPYDGGIVVGLGPIPDADSWSRCVIVDGAIASGSTIMAVIGTLASSTSHFSVFSVHATTEGLWALHRWCELVRAQLSVSVGHVTQGMSSKYYALDPDDPTRLAVGDLGDTITDLP